MDIMDVVPYFELVVFSPTHPMISLELNTTPAASFTKYMPFFIQVGLDLIAGRVLQGSRGEA